MSGLTLKPDQTAADCSKEYMTIFGLDTIRTKLPNDIDGLKVIHRRILYALHQDPEIQKETTLMGKVMRMHPHGDASITDAISTMAQPFTHTIPLVFSESNIGTYVGDKVAGARYIDVGESEAAADLFFADINASMLHMVTCETEDGVEPAYLIPRLPTALLVPSFAIALGFKAETVGTSVEDLCKLTKEYITIRNHEVTMDKTKSLIKYLLPDFATSCVLRNSKQLLHSYRQGNWDLPIITDGKMRVTADRIIVATLPPDKNFKTLTMAVGSQTVDKSSWESQNFQQMEDFSGREQGVMEGAFNCIVRRGMNPFDVLAELKKRLQFTSRWKPIRNYVNYRGRLSYETPFTLLRKWYDVRHDAVVGDLKQKLSNLVERKRQLIALTIVIEDTDGVVQIFKSSKSVAETVPRLCERYKSKNLSSRQAQFLAKLTLSQITAQGKDELAEDLKHIEEQIANLNEKFGEIDKIMIDSIERFEKKYESQFPRHCVVPRYIGTACYRGNGWILLEDYEEMDRVLKEFDPEQIEFNLFQNVGEIIAIHPDEPVLGDVPKYIKADAVIKTDTTQHSAVVVEGGGALVVNGIAPVLEHMTQVVTVGKRFTAITKQGKRLLVDVNDKVIRKSASSGPTMKDVVYVSPVDEEDVIIVHASDAQSNYCTIERVTGNASLHKLVVGHWKVLAVFAAYTQKVVLNIPKEMRARCNTRHIVLDKIADRIPPNSRMGLLYGRGTNKSDFELVPWRRKSTILTVK